MPVLGKIVGGATSVVSTVLGLAISLVVIALAWFRFRPIISLILIVVVAALVFFLKYYKKDNQVEENEEEVKKETKSKK